MTPRFFTINTASSKKKHHLRTGHKLVVSCE